MLSELFYEHRPLWASRHFGAAMGCGLLLASFSACVFPELSDETPPPALGHEGGPCYGNGSCDGDLVCLSDV